MEYLPEFSIQEENYLNCPEKISEALAEARDVLSQNICNGKPSQTAPLFLYCTCCHTTSAGLLSHVLRLSGGSFRYSRPSRKVKRSEAYSEKGLNDVGGGCILLSLADGVTFEYFRGLNRTKPTRISLDKVSNQIRNTIRGPHSYTFVSA